MDKYNWLVLGLWGVGVALAALLGWKLGAKLAALIEAELARGRR